MYNHIRNKTVIVIFDIDDIITVIDTELIMLWNSKNIMHGDRSLTRTRTNILEKAMYNTLTNLGYVISNRDIPKYGINNNSNIIKYISDLLYKLIVDYIKLNINYSYAIDIIIVNNNLQLHIKRNEK